MEKRQVLDDAEDYGVGKYVGVEQMSGKDG